MQHPVSYTHLDVYKRQVTAGTDVLPITSEQVGVFKLMKITAEIKKLHEETKKSGKEVTVRDAVSYTHLDVYKRQLWIRQNPIPFL